ncbi:MAG: gluconate 2-dehydrogenase subunit 3 family protein [Acidobacteriota bacterium]
MNRRELLRRSASVVVGSASLGSGLHAEPRLFPEGFDASKELGRADWTPVFLSAHQNETLILLSDLIIPETKTPGAKAALANRFIDLLLAAEDTETQKAFLNSLSYLDGESRLRYGDALLFVPREAQVELLNFLAYPHRLVTWQSNQSAFPGHEHFRLLKDWISRAYYSSEIGMQELGWQDSPFHEPFQGCPSSGESPE